MNQITFTLNGKTVSADDLVRRAATDNTLFDQAFFPLTFRQESAPFHAEIDQALDNPANRLLLLESFRGSAKTTRVRRFMAKRIAYGLSKTILFVGLSEDHASRSVKWLRSQIERNVAFSSVFSLSPGSKWTETECEVRNNVLGTTVWVLGVGITGSIRGINFDDYRPDLIILDDVLDNENSATRDQRLKMQDLIMGAIKESLTPRSEDPNAKMIMAQTPLHVEDTSQLAKADPSWTHLSIPCWTRETVDLPLDYQQSAWPSRYPTEELRGEKTNAAAANRLSIFLREMECRLISPETTLFRSEWLQTTDDMPEQSYKVLAIDPVPPPSDREISKGMTGKDYEAIGVLGRRGGSYYLYDYVMNRGHQPNWSIAKIFELALQHRVAEIVVESVAYQRTLSYLLEQEMVRRGIYWPIYKYVDTRKKYTRIATALSGPASAGRFFVRPTMTEFITQFSNYGAGGSDKDDLLDMAAIGMSRLVNPVLELGEETYEEIFETRSKPVQMRGCP